MRAPGAPPDVGTCGRVDHYRDAVDPLFVVLAAGVTAPLLSLVTRKVVPGVVFEIGLGIVIGPAVLAWSSATGSVQSVADVGLSFLMFLAGLEVNLRTMRGEALRRSGGSWLVSVALASIVGVVVALAGGGDAARFVAIALTTTALGTLLPILREERVVGTPLGERTLAVGTIGEFGPIVLIALLLSARNPVAVLAELAIFAVVVVTGLWAANHLRVPWLRRSVTQGMHSTSQLPVRVAVLAVAFFVLLADDLGIDALMGAFAAGLVVRTATALDMAEDDQLMLDRKLTAVGFGVFIPIFFVTSGMKMDVASMIEHPTSLLLIPGFVVAALLVRGIPTWWAYRRSVSPPDARSLALLSAAALPLVVVITEQGVAAKALPPEVAAAMVAGGLLSVLVLPLLALRGRARAEDPGTDATAQVATPAA